MSIDYEAAVLNADELAYRALSAHIGQAYRAIHESNGEKNLSNVDIRAIQELSKVSRRARDEERKRIAEEAKESGQPSTPASAKGSPSLEIANAPRLLSIASDRDLKEEPLSLEEREDLGRQIEHLGLILERDYLATTGELPPQPPHSTTSPAESSGQTSNTQSGAEHLDHPIPPPKG